MPRSRNPTSPTTRRWSAFFSRAATTRTISSFRPFTSEYNNYAAIRTPVLAIPQSAILPVTSLDSDGHTYGLHPSCPELQTLFGEGKLAFLFNTGTLVYPVTRAQYLGRNVGQAAAAFFPRRPADAMADFHSRPAADHRLGRTLRGFAECRAAERADFADGFARGREHV